MSISLGSAHGDIVLTATGAQAGVNAAVSALSKLDSSAKQSGQSFDAIGAGAAKAGASTAQGMRTAEAAVGQLATRAQSTSQALGTLGTALGVAGAGVAAGIGVAVKTATDFQSQLSAVKAATQATGGEMEALRSTALALGQDVTLSGVSATGAAQAMEALGKAGISASDQIGGATRGALLLASAGALDFGQAAEIAANALTVFHLQASQTAHVADLFANAANASTIDVRDLALSMNQAGLVAAQMGQSIEQTVGVLTAFGAAGLKGSDAGTSLKQLLVSLVNPSKQAAETMQQLGLNFFDAQGHILSFAGIADQLQTKLKGLTDQQRNEALATIFGSDAIRGALVLYNQGASGIEKYTAVVDKAGAAAEAGKVRNDNFAGSLKQLRDSAEALGIALGSRALPALTSIAKQATDLVNAFNGLSATQQNVIVGVAAGAAGFLLLGGAIIKTTQYARDLTSAISTVIGVFAQKEAAKKSLTAANETLAASMGKTGAAAGSLAPTVAGIAAAVAAVAGAAAILGVAFGVATVKMNEANAASASLAANLSGPLAASVAGIRTDRLEAFLALLTGSHANVTELGAAFQAWANGADKATVSTAELQARYEALLAAVTANPATTTEGVRLQNAALKAFQDELFLRQKLNAEQAIHDRFLTSEAETEIVAVAAANERAAALARVKQTLTEMNAIPPPPVFPGVGGGALAGALAAGQASQELTRATLRYIQVGTDATAIDAAQAAAKKLLVDQFTAQQAAMQNVATAISPLQAAFDQINAKQAVGLPLTQREIALYGQIPGILGQAQGATEALAIAAADTAIASLNAQGGIAALAGASGATSAAIDTLRGSLIALRAGFSAIGQQDAELTGFASLFQARIDALEKLKKDQGGTLDPAQAAELAHLLDLQKQIGDQLGENAAKRRADAEAILAEEAALKRQAAADEEARKARDRAAATAATQTEAAVDPASLAAVAAVLAPKPVPVNLEPAVDDASLAAVRATLGKPVTVPLTVTPQLAQSGFDSATAEALGIIGGGGDKGLTTTQTTTLTVNDQATGPINQVKQLLTDYARLQPNVELKATDNASTTVGILIGDIGNIPPAHDTTLTATDQATGIVQNLIDTINRVPGSLNVVANVDTSGALAAIQELRNQMPSSPAKEGPFRTLPEWGSVFASLAPAGDDAVRTLSSAIRQMGEGLTSGLDAMGADGAKAAAELATTLANAVKASTEALTGLRSFTAPDPGRFRALNDALGPVMAGFAADSAALSKQAQEGASAYAETVSKVVGAVAAATTALGGLREFRRPSDQAINSFRDSAQYLINTMAQVAADSDQKFVTAGADYAEAATKVVSFVSAATQALVGLQRFKRPSDRAILDFRDSAQFLINVMQQVAADGEQQAVSAAGDYADSALKVVQFVSAATSALTGLTDFVRPTDQAVRSFRDVAQFAMNLIAQVAADGEEQAVAGAGQYAEAASQVFAFIATATTALVGLQDFVRPTDAAVRAFASAAQFAVDTIAAVAAATNADMVDAAADYSENAQKVVQLIGAGVTAFKALADGEFVPPDPGRLRQFAQGTLAAVLAIEEASRDIDQRGLDAAARYADGAGKVVQLVGAGAAGFAALATFTAPSAAQIQQFKSAVSATVIAVAQAAKEINADAVKSAGEYADGAGKAVGLLGTAVSAFGGLKDFVAPSAEAITALVNVTRFAVQQLAGISGSFTKPQLDQLKAFGDAASAGFGAIRGALDAGKSLADKDRISPADALGQVLSEFQAGLTPLAALAVVAAQYKATGAQIGADIAAAYAAIGGGAAPGLTPPSAQALALASNTTTTVQRVVTHRFEGQIGFSFLAANGQWIVTSLQIDDKALTGTADLIAGKIADGIHAATAAA